MEKDRNQLDVLTLKDVMEWAIPYSEVGNINNSSGAAWSSDVDYYFEVIKSRMQNIVDITAIPNEKIKKLVIAEGEGELVSSQSELKIKYLGYVKGQNEPYDSSDVMQKTSFLRSTDLYRFDEGGLTKGLMMALASMRKHEISIFWIDSEYAYVECDYKNIVPPNTPVMYLVHLVDFLEDSTVNKMIQAGIKDRHDFPYVSMIAKYLIRNGLKNHQRERFSLAIRDYKRAADLLEDVKYTSEDEQITLNQLLTIVYEHLSYAYIPLGLLRQACLACLAIPNKSCGSYTVLGSLLMDMDKYAEALDQYRIAIECYDEEDYSPNHMSELLMQCEDCLESLKDMEEEYETWKYYLNFNSLFDDDTHECEKAVKALCQQFIKSRHVFRRLLPESYTIEGMEIIQKVTMSLGLSLVYRMKDGRTRMYLQKSKVTLNSKKLKI